MPAKPSLRMAILLGLLGASMVLFAARGRVRRALYGAPATATLVGQPAPPLQPKGGRLEMLAGAAPSLEALRGRVVLVHFWTFG